MNTIILSVLLVSFCAVFRTSTGVVKFKFIKSSEIGDIGLEPDMNGDVKFHAMCEYATRTIYVHQEHWDSLPFVHKRELIYHELGHCIFDLRHAEATEVSIMRPRVYSTKLDGSNWKILIQEMRERIKKKRARYR